MTAPKEKVIQRMAFFFCVHLNPSVSLRSTAPRPGSLFIANQKLSPLAGKVARSAERGMAQRSQAVLLFPLSFAYAQQLPHKWWRLWGTVQTRRTVPYPFAERSFPAARFTRIHLPRQGGFWVHFISFSLVIPRCRADMQANYCLHLIFMIYLKAKSPQGVRHAKAAYC